MKSGNLVTCKEFVEETRKKLLILQLARPLMSGLEKSILVSIINGNQVRELKFNDLVDRYLNLNHAYQLFFAS